MAAPPEKTLKDLSGKWVMNKQLSGDTDGLLALQGMGWILRKGIGLATITLHVSEYTDAEDGKVHLDTKNLITGGIKGTQEDRTLDWTYRDHEDGIFGKCSGRSRIVALKDFAVGDGTEESDVEFLTKGWEEDIDDTHVQSFVQSKTAGWIANQIWGFEVIEGARRHARHVIVRKGEEVRREKLVYDWLGPLDESAAAGTGAGDDGLAYEE